MFFTGRKQRISVTPKTSHTIKILKFTIWLSFLVSLIIFTDHVNNATKDPLAELRTVFTLKYKTVIAIRKPNPDSHKKC